MNRYYKDYQTFLAGHFEGKVQKIAIDLATDCPNRNGTVGRGGCIYCLNQAFSPDFAKRTLGVAAQLQRGKEFFARKYKDMRYLAYFQSYTGTNAPMDRLEKAYAEALADDGVVGMIVSTRPDCVPDEVIGLFCKLREVTGKEVMVELGAESSHNSTLSLINRCHNWEAVIDAVTRLNTARIPVGLHLIMGLPGESRGMMLQTVHQVNRLPVDTVKLHHLQVLRGTPMERMIANGQLPPREEFTPGSYADLCAEVVDLLRPNIAIERFVAQAPEEYLVSPKWGLKNYQFTALLERAIKARREGRKSEGEQNGSRR